jgi:hypothetical protein
MIPFIKQGLLQDSVDVDLLGFEGTGALGEKR